MLPQVVAASPVTSRVRAAATHPAPSHPATPLSPSLSLLLSFFALTLLLTRRLSGKPLHLAMRCKSTGRGTQLVRSRKWEGGGSAEEALTVPTSLPLATRQSRLDSTLMSSIFSRTFCRYFVVSPSSPSVFCYFFFFLLTMLLCENMRNCNNNN